MTTKISNPKAETKSVIIPIGTNFNTAKKTAIPILCDSIISALPQVLRDGVNRLVEPNDKQVFLTTALATLSGVMPNVSGYYDGKIVAPNLYAFIIGDYGSGKGAMQYARKLIEPIEAYFEDRNNALLAEYANLPTEEKENARPKLQGLVIPANASASMFLQILDDQDGQGILFETEGDTLAQTLATDHGNYSDILRKAFQHEGTAMARRTGNERRHIKAPKLSTVLTGTPDQFKKLIPDPQNGLFSRFLYLTIKPETGFRDVFDKAKTRYEDEFTRLGGEVYDLYMELAQDGTPSDDKRLIEFTFSDEQKRRFVEAYKTEKPRFIDDTGIEANGVFNRLGLINFRLAMVLSVLRAFQSDHSVPNTIVCTDGDYRAAKRLTEVLTDQSKDVYYLLPEAKTDAEDSFSALDPEIQAVMRLHHKGRSTREIAQELRLSKSTVHRRIKTGLSQSGTP